MNNDPYKLQQWTRIVITVVSIISLIVSLLMIFGGEPLVGFSTASAAIFFFILNGIWGVLEDIAIDVNRIRVIQNPPKSHPDQP